LELDETLSVAEAFDDIRATDWRMHGRTFPALEQDMAWIHGVELGDIAEVGQDGRLYLKNLDLGDLNMGEAQPWQDPGSPGLDPGLQAPLSDSVQFKAIVVPLTGEILEYTFSADQFKTVADLKMQLQERRDHIGALLFMPAEGTTRLAEDDMPLMSFCEPAGGGDLMFFETDGTDGSV